MGRARPRRSRASGRERSARVDDPLEAEAVAALAGAVRRVEREDPRLDLWHRGAAVQACEPLRSQTSELACAGLVSRLLDAAAPSARPRRAVGELRRLDRLREALAHVLLYDQAVDHDRDVVLVFLSRSIPSSSRRARRRSSPARSPAQRISSSMLPVLALSPADDGRHHHEALALLDGAARGRRSARATGPAMGSPELGQWGYRSGQAGAGSRRSR